jgi:hypothetical protein
MQITETARIRLLIDGKEAIGELTTMEQKLKETNEAKKQFTRGSDEWKALNTEARELGTSIKLLQERMDVGNMTYKEALSYQRDLKKEMSNLKQGSDDYIKASGRLTEVNKHIDGIRKDFNHTGETVKNSGGVWSNLKNWVVAAFAVTAIIEFAKRIVGVGLDIFELTKKFEKYRVVLSNTLGGQSEAVAAMRLIKEIAASTPFSVDELTGSFIKLVNRGVKPTKEEIVNLGDLAASQAKSFEQLVEAVLDAQVGENERLKEFGIKAKTAGDMVSLSFKGQTVTVKKNEEAIYQALVAMGKYEGVANVMSEVSKTLEGRVSNLGDAWDFVYLKLGDLLMPVFVKLVEFLGKAVDWISKTVDELGPLGVAFETVWEVVGIVANIFKTLFLSIMPAGAGNAITVSNVIKLLATAITGLTLPIRLVLGSLQLLIDYLIVAGNASKILIQILKGDFTAAAVQAAKTSMAWDSLKNNATKNFTKIGEDFKKIWSDTPKHIAVAADSVDMYGKLVKKTEEDQTDTAKNEGDKRKGIKKGEADAEKNLNKELAESKKDLKTRLLQLAIEQKEESIREKQAELDRTQSIYVDAYSKIKDVIDNYNNYKNEADKKYTDALKARIENSAEEINKISTAVNTSSKKSAEDYALAVNDWYRSLGGFKRQLIDGAIVGFEAMLGAANNYFDKIIETSEDSGKKIGAMLGKEMLKPWQENINATKALLQGDLVGTAQGLFGYFKGMWDMTLGMKKTIREINLADFQAGFEKRFEELAIFNDAIRVTFKEFVREIEMADNAGHSSKQKTIQAEIDLGNKIRENYELAKSQETELYNAKIASIESTFSLEMQRINEVYALRGALANDAFNKDTLAVKDGLNEQLLAFVTNEESKSSVMAEFATKRSEILRITSEADRQITDEMDQATIDAILAARQLRDTELVRLADWYTKELELILKNEDQKRVEISATEKLIRDAEEAIDILRIEKAAADIDRNLQKNIELKEAEAAKNAEIETAAQIHNDNLVALAETKDAQLRDSFERLKNAYLAGYAEMESAAQRAYAAGVLNLEQYQQALDRLQAARQLFLATNTSIDQVQDRFDFVRPTVDGGGVAEFGDGGILAPDYFENNGVLGGLSHNTSEGGNWVINPRTGKIQAKVEAGEWLGIINKNSTAKYKDLLYTLANSSAATTGVPVFAEKGYFGSPNPVDAPKVVRNISSNNFNATNELQIELMQILIQKTTETNILLESVAMSSHESAKKKLTLSVREIIKQAALVAEIDNRSSFR